MARFRYKVKDRAGRVFEGTVDAADQHAAAAAMHAQDYFILDLHQDAESYPPPPARPGEIEPGRDVRAAFGRGLGPRALGNFFRSLAQLLHAGVDVSEAADSLSQTARGARLRRIASEISTAASGGESMSSVLHRHAEAFPPIVLGMIKAGEKSGNLEDSAASLADYFEGQHRFRTSLLAAIALPMALIMVFIFLKPFLFTLFRAATGAAENVAQTYVVELLTTAMPFIVLFGGIALVIYLQARNWPLARHLDRVYLGVPWIGSIERRRSLGRWAQAYAMLWEAGISQAEALELSAPSAANRAIVYALWRLVPGAREGRPLSQLLGSLKEVPPEMAHVVATGEESGLAGDSLRRLGEAYGMESEAGGKKMIVAAYVGLYLLVIIVFVYAILQMGMNYRGILEKVLEGT